MEWRISLFFWNMLVGPFLLLPLPLHAGRSRAELQASKFAFVSKRLLDVSCKLLGTMCPFQEIMQYLSGQKEGKWGSMVLWPAMRALTSKGEILISSHGSQDCWTYFMYCPFIANCGKVVRVRGDARFPGTTETAKKCLCKRGTVRQLITEGCYEAQTKAHTLSHSLEIGSSSGKYPLERI